MNHAIAASVELLEERRLLSLTIPPAAVHLDTTALPLATRTASVAAIESVAALTAAARPAAAGLTHNVAALSQPRGDFAAVAVGTQVVFAGGQYTDDDGYTVPSNVVDIYDTVTGRWSVASLHRAGNPAAAVVGDIAIFATGDTADVYDSTTGRWSTTTFSHSHDYATGVSVIGSRAIFAGGDLKSGQSDVVDIYDAATGRCSTARLSEARFAVAAVTVGDQAIFAGGYTGDAMTYEGSDVVDVYDGQTGRWFTTRLSTPGRPPISIVGKRVVFQGYDALDIYDTDTGGWSTTELPRDHYGPAVAVAGDKIVFAGGYVEGFTFTEVYDTTTGRWTSGALREGRWGIAAATLGSTAIFAGGDNDDGLRASDSVDLYDGATGQWSAGRLAAAREGLTVATIGTDVLFAGGFNAGTYDENGGDVTSKVIDVFGGATGQWSTAALSAGRFDISATVANGHAFLAGGSTDAGFSAVVDVYAPGDLRAPANPSPSTSGGIAKSPVALSWSVSPGATGYDVYLDDALVAANVTSNHWTLDRTLARGLHTWQAVARNGSGVTGSPRWSFTVGAPTPVTNPSPPPGSALAVPPATFSWAPSTGATGYDVYLDGALLQTVTVPQCTLSRPIDGGAHTWRVVARNAYTTTASPTWTFSTPASNLVHTTGQLSQPRGGLAATTVGHFSLFAGGGSDVVDVYDSLTGHWSTSHLSTSRTGLAATSVGPLALFAGGGSDLVDIYDSATGRWSTARLSQAHSGLAATTVGNFAVFAGGDSNVVEIYDASTGRWSTARLSTPRGGLAATSAGGLALFAGGYDQDGNASDVVDVFNVATGQWTTARLSVARGGLAATSVGQLAFFAGGSTASGGAAATDAVDIYDAGTGRWSTAKLWRARSNLVAATAGAKALFARGWSDVTGDSNAVDVYDTVTGRWSLATLSSGGGLTAGTGAGGVAIFAGGGGPYALGDAVDLFTDPAPAPVATGSITALSGQAVSLDLTNSGDAPLPGPYHVAVYGATPHAPSVLLGSITVGKTLAAGSTRQITVPISIATDADVQDYRLSLSIDGGRQLATIVPRVGLTPPTATLIPGDPLADPRSSYAFSIAYHDDHRIDATTFDDADVLVTGPSGFSGHARFVSDARGGRGSTRVATYVIDGPDGRWDDRADGDYLVRLLPDQVADTNGNAAPSALLGTLRVRIPTLPAPPNLTHTAGSIGYVDLLAATSVGDKAFLAGGAVQIYDAATGQWSSAPLSQQRWQLGATTVGTKAIFAGGSPGGGNLSDVVDIFDTATGRWSTSTLPKPRYNLTGLNIGRKAIFLGGSDADSIRSYEAYVLDTATGLWSTVTLPGGCTGAATVGSKVIFPGGSYWSGRRGRFYTSRDALIYDDDAGQWSTDQLPAVDVPFGDGGAALPAVVGNKAIFARGGYLQIYDDANGQWSAVPTRLNFPVSAVAAGTQVVVTDGDDVRIYDCATGQLSSGRLSQKRSGPVTAAALGTRVFFAGGVVENGGAIGTVLSSDVVDVYDTAAGQWSTTRLVEPRTDPTPVSVTNHLIFAGGWDIQAGASSDQADVFTDTAPA